MNSFQPILLIRADADPTIGSGHVMRCLAIAQTWLRTGGTVHFACRDLPDPLRDRLVRVGCSVQPTTAKPGSEADAKALSEIARSLAADWIIVDGYAFGVEFQQQVLATSGRLLVVRDDDGPTHVRANTILNTNVFAQREFYSVESASELLIGPSYALLRDEFRDAARCQSDVAPQVRRVLVTFGGADPNDMTSRALAALDSLNDPELHVDVVVGSCSTRQSLPSGSKYRMQVRWRQNVSNMASLMSRADIAVTAGGSTCFELAAVGVPMFIVAIADNQLPVAESLGRLGAAVYLGQQADLRDPELANEIQELFHAADRRRAIAETAKRLVDGRGTNRVVDRMLRPLIRLRPANADDSRQLFDWQRDPIVRRWSFSEGPNEFDEHCSWLAQKLADKNSHVFVCESESGAALGCVRLDLRSGRAVIGLLLDAAFRGRGLAAVVLGAALDRIGTQYPCLEIDALIKPENESSRRSFAAVGFAFRSLERVDGQPAERWTMRLGQAKVANSPATLVRLPDSVPIPLAS